MARRKSSYVPREEWAVRCFCSKATYALIKKLADSADPQPVSYSLCFGVVCDLVKQYRLYREQ